MIQVSQIDLLIKQLAGEPLSSAAIHHLEEDIASDPKFKTLAEDFTQIWQTPSLPVPDFCSKKALQRISSCS